MTTRTLNRLTLVVGIFCLGCGGEQAASAPPARQRAPIETRQTVQDDAADEAKIKSVDISVLFFGNSHTGHHDIPKLVGRMIAYRLPKLTYHSHFIGCGFLADAAANPNSKATIERHPWKFIVLQAQKISMSGKHRYSQKEGTALAKAARDRGAQAFFFSEWGRRDVPNDGVVQESIYQEMADAAGVCVAPVGRAWDVALAQKPTLPLYDSDGNHESAVGAFLTACVFFGLFTDADPAELASFDHLNLSREDRAVMANAASNVWKDERAKKAPRKH
jgi:hypothetical protein